MKLNALVCADIAQKRCLNLFFQLTKNSVNQDLEPQLLLGHLRLLDQELQLQKREYQLHLDL